MTNELPPILWNKNFSLYWLGIALAALGDAFVYVALPFLVLDLTGSAGALATVVMLNSLPRFLGPVIGALADRMHLRLPLTVVGLVRAAVFAVLGLLALSGELSLWLVYVGAPLSALLTSFVFAAGNVLVPHLVPRKQLARANSLMQAAVMGVPLLGFGVAGALVAGVGAGLTIVLAAPCFLALALACPWIGFPAVLTSAARVGFVRDLVRGASFFLRSGPLAFLLVTSLLLNAALNVLNVTMPVIMERIGWGARGYGLFETALSVGMLLGILGVSAVGTRLATPYQISLSQALMAGGFALLSLGGLAWYIGGGTVLGIGLGFGEVAVVTLLQLTVPDGMRGKVLGFIFSVNALGLTFGAWLAGALVDLATFSTIYAASAGIGLLLCLVWTALLTKGRHRLEQLIEAAA